MGRLAVMVIVGGLTLAGCGTPYPADRVTEVADDDPRMNAAMDKARSTVGSMLSALKSPRSGQTGFTVKMPFTDGSNTEHVWLAPVSYDGKMFHGTVSNEPNKVHTFRMGQPASVAPTEISDWMYMDHGKLVGGYTLRVLRDTLPPRERAKFDQEARFLDE